MHFIADELIYSIYNETNRNARNLCNVNREEGLIEIQNLIDLVQLPIGKLPLSESHISKHISIQLLMVQIDPKEMRL